MEIQILWLFGIVAAAISAMFAWFLTRFAKLTDSVADNLVTVGELRVEQTSLRRDMVRMEESIIKSGEEIRLAISEVRDHQVTQIINQDAVIQAIEKLGTDPRAPRAPK